MLAKLVRSDYYNEDYLLNNHEYKGKHQFLGSTWTTLREK